MFFKRKGWLRKEYNEKLLLQIEDVKKSRHQQLKLLEQCLDPSEEVICQTKLTEAKYFFLLKEAKERNISLMK